jgi:hypothetical protein
MIYIFKRRKWRIIYVKQASNEGAFATDSFSSSCATEYSSIQLRRCCRIDDVKRDRLRLQQVKRETWRALTATRTGSQKEETERGPTLSSKGDRDAITISRA